MHVDARQRCPSGGDALYYAVIGSPPSPPLHARERSRSEREGGRKKDTGTRDEVVV